jgi:DNA-binding winged helix-turn-helix (wHTH) protein/tetratricopeptide (TPR) repeat protein
LAAEDFVRGAKKAAGTVELDLGRYELRRAGQRVPLEKKAMELLIFLVGRRDQMVSREDIVRKLWRSDLFIDTERNVNNIVRKVRTALGDDSARPRFLETVIGKGYRFIGPVRVIDAQYGAKQGTQLLRADSGSTSSAAPGMDSAGARGDRSSLAVLPLLLLGKAADDDGLGLGFADALVSRLGNLQGLDVLPTSAVLNLPAETTAAEAATRLGIRFVVHGALQVSKGQWRLSLEVFDSYLQGACFTRKCDLDVDHRPELENDLARQIASALNRPLGPVGLQKHPRHSRDPLAYAEFMRGYRLSASGDPRLLEQASHHLANAVTRDPAFSLAHATLALACATRHFEFDPANVWLDKAEFHCQRALELDPDLPEGHVARAFLLWGPSKNFQHLAAIAELKRALALQTNLPHAYNRLASILAHIGLLDHAREMYERGRPFHPRKAVSPSIVQVHVWNREPDLARETIQTWRRESPGNKYAIYFAPQPAMMTGDWKEAEPLLEEAVRLLPEDPLITSLQGVFSALTGKEELALDFMTKACASPKSFGHAHHNYYQIACILALAGRREAGLEWLERSVGTGFACWPFFLKDPCLKNLRGMPEFELLVSSLQAKYPDHLGLL